MTRRSRIAMTLGVVLVVAAVLASFSGRSGDDSGPVIPAADRRSPVTLAGEDLTGARVDVAAFRGAPVVVNFWASWCGPCEAEQPELERAAEAMRSEGVRFVGVNIRETNKAAARAFVQDHRVSYPSLVDPDLAHSIEFGVSAPPATFILDAAGRVAARLPGQITSGAELAALVRQVAGESG